MELAGSEEKIRALFRELKLVDQHVAPEFISVWNRAQTPSSGPLHVFKISLALATALFVITLSSLLLWSQNWQRSRPSNPGIATGPPAILGSRPAPPSATQPTTSGRTHPGVPEPPNRVKSDRGDRRVAARRHADLNARNADIRDVHSLSNWQSPTATLMQSPADDVLTSLPQLDRSIMNLQTFLPNTPSYQNRER